MKIIVFHVLPNLDKVNYGVWNVVLNSIINTKDKKITSYLVCLNEPKELMDELNVIKDKLIYKSDNEFIEFIQASYSYENTVIVSHGNWTRATYVGNTLALIGYKWLVYPHGMLEPWAMRHKGLKKWIYFNLIEKRWLQLASRIIAVGKPEYLNLAKLFGEDKISHLPNGTVVPDEQFSKYEKPIIFLFMARLHKKKGIVELVKAWKDSILNNNDGFILKIIGPDEGELNKIQTLSRGVENILILGPKYGNEKAEILMGSSFFVLPSFSEGFPTSIVEAMSYACVPIITSGCNFPEATDIGSAIETTTNPIDIRDTLNRLARYTKKLYLTKSEKAFNFVRENYSIETIVSKQIEMFNEVINED